MEEDKIRREASEGKNGKGEMAYPQPLDMPLGVIRISAKATVSPAGIRKVATRERGAKGGGGKEK
jgi:hypothetical protein